MPFYHLALQLEHMIMIKSENYAGKKCLWHAKKNAIDKVELSRSEFYTGVWVEGPEITDISGYLLR